MELRTSEWMKAAPFVKICGVTSSDEAAICASNGVDAIGLLIEKPNHPKKQNSDRLSINRAAEIGNFAHGLIKTFLLIHTDNSDFLHSHIQIIRPTALQICIKIDPELLLWIRKNWPEVALIHSMRVKTGSIPEQLCEKIEELLTHDILDGIVLDSAQGGSGNTHDWTISQKVVETFPRIPALLAGGISSVNAVEALRVVNCAGVDVMSSVKRDSRGGIDRYKVHELVSKLRNGGGI